MNQVTCVPALSREEQLQEEIRLLRKTILMELEEQLEFASRVNDLATRAYAKDATMDRLNSIKQISHANYGRQIDKINELEGR